MRCNRCQISLLKLQISQFWRRRAPKGQPGRSVRNDNCRCKWHECFCLNISTPPKCSIHHKQLYESRRGPIKPGSTPRTIRAVAQTCMSSHLSWGGWWAAVRRTVRPLLPWQLVLFLLHASQSPFQEFHKRCTGAVVGEVGA